MADIDISLARKVLETVDAGLCSGVGEPIPGRMCVEAAMCYAMGLPHGDQPTCVQADVRRFKIALNDKDWSSNEARAKGLRRIAIAQLGSADVVDGRRFRHLLAEKCIRTIVPIALRAAGKCNPKHAEALESAAIRCASEGTRESADSARNAAAYAAASAYAASSYASDYKERDRVLGIMAELGVDVLRKLKSPGVLLVDELIPKP